MSNHSDRCHVLPIVERSTSIDFLGDIKVKTLSPIELFASKLNALLNRAAVRDAYDIHNMIAANLFEREDERQLLRKILVFYVAVGSNCKAEEVTLDFVGFDQIESLSFTQVRAQLLPVLRTNEKFDISVVKDEIISYLKDFLVFSEEELEFVQHFNNRDYRPEVLFHERDISEGVKSHPMALWKCRPVE